MAVWLALGLRRENTLGGELSEVLLYDAVTERRVAGYRGLTDGFSLGSDGTVAVAHALQRSSHPGRCWRSRVLLISARSRWPTTTRIRPCGADDKGIVLAGRRLFYPTRGRMVATSGGPELSTNTVVQPLAGGRRRTVLGPVARLESITGSRIAFESDRCDGDYTAGIERLSRLPGTVGALSPCPVSLGPIAPVEDGVVRFSVQCSKGCGGSLALFDRSGARLSIPSGGNEVSLLVARGQSRAVDIPLSDAVRARAAEEGGIQAEVRALTQFGSFRLDSGRAGFEIRG